jgi:hypothetical protein
MVRCLTPPTRAWARELNAGSHIQYGSLLNCAARRLIHPRLMLPAGQAHTRPVKAVAASRQETPRAVGQLMLNCRRATMGT